MIRIGIGKDLHRLTEGRRFILGGVEIPCNRGELGFSDGDVLTHAIMDAILGAAGLGDIGEFFPPGDPKWKNADSLELLRIVMEKFEGADWKIINIDCVVCCEEPKVLPHRNKIQNKLAVALGINTDAIFVKGKTGEGLGEIGRGEAVEATAVCLAEKR